MPRWNCKKTQIWLYWSDTNPQITFEKEMYPEKVIIWCCIIDPCLFDSIINGETYIRNDSSLPKLKSFKDNKIYVFSKLDKL